MRVPNGRGRFRTSKAINFLIILQLKNKGSKFSMSETLIASIGTGTTPAVYLFKYRIWIDA
jgi:hypothetical protein